MEPLPVFAHNLNSSMRGSSRLVIKHERKLSRKAKFNFCYSAELSKTSTLV
jgi:hypothetical protein